ncbi:hypothetical protein WH47_07409 [Habropoda laboriosa]|uniref:Uncharacterized protein n=1 Tax=Habropoda laboriosa TaxID=597456 RepID=A0A0L7R654_9HYME|nr:hypothetical protein WH47_07409 [Habropoda laboriosa]
MANIDNRKQDKFPLIRLCLRIDIMEDQLCHGKKGRPSREKVHASQYKCIHHDRHF